MLIYQQKSSVWALDDCVKKSFVKTIIPHVRRNRAKT